VPHRWTFILGIAGNTLFVIPMLMGAFVPPSFLGVVSIVGYALGIPALAFYYIFSIIMLWQKAAWQRWLRFLAPVGRMALTNYLLQSVICILIFYRYGFGLFGKIGAAPAALMAIIIFIFQMIVSTWWFKHFNYGPMEWIWRRLTYSQSVTSRFHLPERIS
jgi:uncharacterized protein